MTSQDYRKLSVLLAQIKGGERNAFASVYKMYEKKVYFLFCKLLGKSQAADMTAELFAHIYLQIANFPDAMEFEKWMYTTLFARARRFLLEKNPEAFGEYADTDSPDGIEADELLSQDADEMMSYPDGIDITGDMLRTTDSVLTELPLKLRSAVLGYYLCGFDQEELAAIEQISVMAVKNRLLKARIKMKTQEHKFTELGYNCSGLVVFLPDILATMSQTIVINTDIASAVSSRTGIQCERQGDIPRPAAPVAEVPKSPQYAPTQYALVPEKKRRFGDDVSPTVKVLTAIVALLIIIGGTVAVVLAVQHSKKTPEQGTVGNIENVADEPVTIDITLKETTTAEEQTSEEESTTAEETTTGESTTAEEATTAPETTEAETTQPEEAPEADNEPELPEEDENYAVG